MSSLVVFGDSVPWGQGLREEHKFSRSFHTALEHEHGPVDYRQVAHSGAIIGWRNRIVSLAQPGEVPVARPTIRQQVTDYADSPADVRWVIINGGINDVSIYRLLNPLVSANSIRQYTETHCRDDLGQLLELTARKFSAARLFVIGYYPILSYASDPWGVEALLSARLGFRFQPLTDDKQFKNTMVEHCLQFWRLSGPCIAAAVAHANTAIGGPRCVFVDPGFTEANAAFAPSALLWGVGTNPLEPFSPLDEVVAQRVAECAAARLNPAECFACQRASAGHPNVAGAEQISRALLAAASG